MKNERTLAILVICSFLLLAFTSYKVGSFLAEKPVKVTPIKSIPTYKENLSREISRREREIEDRAYQIKVEATAYWVMDPVEASGTGIAADGTPAVPYKTIAVDPKVIPLQSKVYVPGIGWCRANDTGGAVKGNIIDIAMESRESAFKWGRRDILVKVIPPKK